MVMISVLLCGDDRRLYTDEIIDFLNWKIYSLNTVFEKGKN